MVFLTQNVQVIRLMKVGISALRRISVNEAEMKLKKVYYSGPRLLRSTVIPA